MNNLLLRRTDTRYRPLMHFSAEKGWINDPNGLIYFKGKYHLFYQHNPHSAVWSSMHWGHAISTDMLHWEDLPIALYPDADYDKDSEGGCFSGSAIEKDGRLYLMYTGTVHRNGNCYQTQNIAYSDDGITFTKYKNNPIIYKPEGAGEDFRDPKIFFYDGLYYAVIGGTIDNDGKVFLYTSSDILHWEYKGILFDSEGKVATMIECPDFFFLDGHWVLIFSPIGNPDRRKCIYYAGDMDFNTCRFTPRWNGIMDYGPDFYAPQTFLDKNGNRVMIAWMNRWQWMPYAEEREYSEKEGWRGALTLPRILHLDEGYRLWFSPLPEFVHIFSKTDCSRNINISNEVPFVLPRENAERLKISFIEDKIDSAAFTIRLSDFSSIVLDLLSRKCMYIIEKNGGYGIMSAPLCNGNNHTLDIILDKAEIEIFIDDGFSCITAEDFSNQKPIEFCTPYKTAELDYISVSH